LIPVKGVPGKTHDAAGFGDVAEFGGEVEETGLVRGDDHELSMLIYRKKEIFRKFLPAQVPANRPGYLKAFHGEQACGDYPNYSPRILRRILLFRREIVIFAVKGVRKLCSISTNARNGLILLGI
jgi:hypothetical protein